MGIFLGFVFGFVVMRVGLGLLFFVGRCRVVDSRRREFYLFGGGDGDE